MNPWLSRATEKLHFAELALAAAAEASGRAGLAAPAHTAMFREAAAMHAWGGWLATLNAIAQHLNLPVRDFPSADTLARDAREQGVHAEALGEIEMLRQAGTWLHQLELAWLASWRLRSVASPSIPAAGMLATDTGSGAQDTDLGPVLVACRSFLERHSAVMEEW